MDPRRRKWWRPTYSGNRRTANGGKEAFHWTVDDTWESECPVSAITQRSYELVQIVNVLDGANKATGSVLGADEMPGYLLDAIRAIRSEDRAVESAMDEAAHA